MHRLRHHENYTLLSPNILFTRSKYPWMRIPSFRAGHLSSLTTLVHPDNYVFVSCKTLFVFIIKDNISRIKQESKYPPKRNLLPCREFCLNIEYTRYEILWSCRFSLVHLNKYLSGWTNKYIALQYIAPLHLKSRLHIWSTHCAQSWQVSWW